MISRSLNVVAAIALASLPPAIAAQAPSGAKAGAVGKPATKKVGSLPRTPWGDPDLQGIWNDATSTPLQRPSELAGKDVLSEEEAEDFQQQTAQGLSRDRRDGGRDADVNRAYNEHWMDSRRLKITADHRTSLIVDPADGRIPPPVPLSPERQKVRATRADSNARFAAGLPKDVSDMSLPVRCIIRTDSPPYLPTIYNNNFHIFQAPGYVAIAPEMIHSARIIPLDGRPHLGTGLHQWLGDTRGRWDGPTLVVETTNFRGDDGVVFQGANPATYRITERFTRVDADTLNYEFTIEDPMTWARAVVVARIRGRIDPDEQMYDMPATRTTSTSSTS